MTVITKHWRGVSTPKSEYANPVQPRPPRPLRPLRFWQSELSAKWMPAWHAHGLFREPRPLDPPSWIQRPPFLIVCTQLKNDFKVLRKLFQFSSPATQHSCLRNLFFFFFLENDRMILQKSDLACCLSYCDKQACIGTLLFTTFN